MKTLWNSHWARAASLLAAVMLAPSIATASGFDIPADAVRSVRTHEHEIRISSDDTLLIAQVSRRLRDYAERSEKRLGHRLPYPDAAQLHIHIESTQIEHARTRFAQAVAPDGTTLQQRILVEGYYGLPEELFIDTICEAFLSAVCHRRQSVGGGTLEAPRVPGWFARGFGQQLFPELRSRNHFLAGRDWSNKALPALKTVLEEREPELHFRPYEEAAVAWMLRGPDAFQPVLSAFDIFARGVNVGPNWLAAKCGNARGAADADAVWNDWLAERRQRVFATARVSGYHMRQLEMALHGDTSGPERGANIISPETLIKLRDAAGTAESCKARIIAIRHLAVGKPTAFGNVVQGYVEFFEGIIRHRWRRTLKKRLETADAAFAELYEAVSAEASAPAPSEAPFPNSGVGVEDDLGFGSSR